MGLYCMFDDLSLNACSSLKVVHTEFVKTHPLFYFSQVMLSRRFDVRRGSEVAS